MRSRLFAVTGLFAVAVSFLSGCSLVQAAGPSVTEDVMITDVDAVELATSGDLSVKVGASPTLTVTAGEAVIERLTTEISDGTLRLGIDDPPLGWDGPIRYELTVTRLESLTVLGSGDADVDFIGATAPSITVRGSGDVEAKGIAAERVELTLDGSGGISSDDVSVSEALVRVDGSGDVRLSGRTEHQDVEVRGSGDYLAAGLVSASARIVVRGSGDAEVTADRALEVVIDGSAEVVYGGEAAVTEHVSGSGGVRRR